MNHVMQHPDSPTWCIHCGRFDVYCDGDCTAEPTGRFNSFNPEVFVRMAHEIFGLPETEQERKFWGAFLGCSW